MFIIMVKAIMIIKKIIMKLYNDNYSNVIMLILTVLLTIKMIANKLIMLSQAVSDGDISKNYKIIKIKYGLDVTYNVSLSLYQVYIIIYLMVKYIKILYTSSSRRERKIIRLVLRVYKH